MIKTQLWFDDTEMEFLEYVTALEINLYYDLKLEIGDKISLCEYVATIPLADFREIQQNTNISDENLSTLKDKLLNYIDGYVYIVEDIRFDLKLDKSVTKCIDLKFELTV